MAVTNTQLAQYALATFGIAPGGFNTTLSTFANANGEVALLNALLKLPASPFGNVTDNGAFALSLVQNVIGDTATAANKNLLVSLIATNLDAGVSRGQMVKALVDALAAMPTTDANWGTAAATFTNKVTVGEYYTTKGGTSTDLTTLTSVVSSVTKDAASVTTAKSGIDNGYAGYAVQNLTTSTDTVTGTAGNDMILGTLGTLNAADSISDSVSTDADILTATVDDTWTLAATAKLAGIETVNLTGKYGSVGLDGTTVGASVTGVKALNLDSAIAAGTATVKGAGAASIAAVKAGTNISSLSVTNSATGGAVTVDAGAATTVTVAGGAASDTFTVTLANGTNTLSANGGTGTDAYTLNLKGGTLTLAGDANNEALTINASGAAQTVNATATVATGTSSAGTITLTGDQSITLKDTAANLTGVTLTDSTTGSAVSTVKLTSVGGTAADLSKVAADKLEVVDVSGTSAVTFADNANVLWSGNGTTSKVASVKDGAGTLNITANAANVMFEKGTTNFATVKVAVDTATTLTAVMDATKTSLVLTGAKDVTVAATSTAKALDASALTGALTVTLDSPSNITKITGGSGADTFKMSNTPSTAVTVDAGAGSDTLSVTSNADFSGAGVKASVITGIELIDIAAGKTLILTQKQLFTNGNAITLNAGTGGALVVTDDGSSSTVFDVSGLKFDPAGAAIAKVTVTGSTAKVNTITGSAAADSIVGGAAADTINGGAGNDSITGAGGADVINVGAGTDTIVMGGIGQTYSAATAATIVSGTTVLTGIDKVTGMAAGDKIDLSAILNAYTGAAGTTIASASGATVALVRGNFADATNVFTTDAAGTSTLFVYDADGVDPGTAVEAIVLVGTVLSAAPGTAATGVVTLA